MKVEVRKLTDIELLHRANSFTTGNESHMSLAKAYKHSHSPIRTQEFWVEMTEIPLFVASQFVRSHIGIEKFQLSKRTDRGGEDFRAVIQRILADLHLAWDRHDAEAFEEVCSEILSLTERFDRYTPVNLAFICNAEALINMAHKRLCSKASQETREIFKLIKLSVKLVDPDLADHLVPQCWYRGGICPEAKCCGLNKSVQAEDYYKLFNN